MKMLTDIKVNVSFLLRLNTHRPMKAYGTLAAEIPSLLTLILTIQYKLASEI
jgi:hypothetical protein